MMTNEHAPHRHDLVEPQGVNAGTAGGERDRLPDGEPPATDAAAEVPPAHDAQTDGRVGMPGEPAGTPGQQLAAGEG
jgi:hypothetical protein